MKIYLSALNIPGSFEKGTNPLPFFRAPAMAEVQSDGTLTSEESYKLGKDAGYRALPYRIHDRYDRNKKHIQLKTVILENDVMRAEFLPEQGGRLYSFVNKKSGRDVFFRNPVYQPCNLAILDAWYSGGVEWNIAQYGHTFSTNSPVFFAKVQEDGYEFLRMYDYERCKKLFYQIDFHLPEGSEVIYAYTRIINDGDCAMPFYWWTNAALPENRNVRVFSSTDEVMFLRTESEALGGKNVHVAGHARLPFLPTLPGVDSSYPSNSNYSNEYFFQNKININSAWSAAVYDDGTLYFNCSTKPLRFHKMFCWGSHRGGRNWCDYLSIPGDESHYIELQAGLAPSQLSGIDLEANTSVCFTQAFAATSFADRSAPYGKDWCKSRDYIREQIIEALPEKTLMSAHKRFEAYADSEISEILSSGSGWGALESMRREHCEGKRMPTGFSFPPVSLGNEQLPWISLLKNGVYPDDNAMSIPASWMIDEEWMTLLTDSMTCPGGDNTSARLHLGVMKYELFDFEGAISEWMKSYLINKTPWNCRNLAVASRERGYLKDAAMYMEEAVTLENNCIDKAFTEEYLDFLLAAGDFRTAFKKYCELPNERKQDECIMMKAGRAALELGDTAFVEALLSREFAHIKEGDNSLVEMWFRQEAEKEAISCGVTVTDELYKEVSAKKVPPSRIDFRMK